MFNNEWLDKNTFTVRKCKIKENGKEVVGLVLPHYLQNSVSTGAIKLLLLNGDMKVCNLSMFESIKPTRVMATNMRKVLDEVIEVAREWNKCNMYLRRGTRGYTVDREINATTELNKVISKMPKVYATAYKKEDVSKEAKPKVKEVKTKSVRNITELVGRVVEWTEDNKRYLVMPMELRRSYFADIIGTIEGKVSYDDLIFKDSVAIMPLDGVPEQRIQKGRDFVEGTHFIVRNIKPEEVERVKLLNDSMSLVLSNIKKLYYAATELKELEEKQKELELKIKKAKDARSTPLSLWSRPANNSYLIELYGRGLKTIKAKERLKDSNRPLYNTSLTGTDNATKEDILELLKVTKKPMYHRYGLGYRGAKDKPITREQAIKYWSNGGPNGGFMDMKEYEDSVHLNEYSSNDMW